MRLSALRPLVALATFLLSMWLTTQIAYSWAFHSDLVDGFGDLLFTWADNHNVAVTIEGKQVIKARCSEDLWFTSVDGRKLPCGPVWTSACCSGTYTAEWRNLSALIREAGYVRADLEDAYSQIHGFGGLLDLSQDAMAEVMLPLGRLGFKSLNPTD